MMPMLIFESLSEYTMSTRKPHIAENVSLRTWWKRKKTIWRSLRRT